MKPKTQNFRSFITSQNLLVLAGKNSEQNEQVIKQAEKGELILHTHAPGSPFCVIKAPAQKVGTASLKEAAIFCAAFSKAFKHGSKSIGVHLFKKEEVYKTKAMPQGTFGVRKILKRLSVKPELAIGLKGKEGKGQKEELQCSPPSALAKILLPLRYSTLPKEQAAAKIASALEKKGIKTSTERIMQLIPSQGFGI